MKLVIEMPDNYAFKKDFSAPEMAVIISAVLNGVSLDSIISQIEQARDKDKLCEYPYNRCIEILRRAVDED